MPRDFLNDSSPSPSYEQPKGRDFLDQSIPHESLGMSLGMAIPRVFSDIGESAYNFANKVPGYLEQAPDQLKGLFQTMQSNSGPFQTQGGHPGHAAMQGLAGLNEGINKVAQIPGNLAEYGEKRLNLVPHGVTEAIKNFGPQDTSQAIQQLFGQPQHPGEDLLRGIGRNIPEIVSGGKIASTLNPLKYTNKNVARNIVETGDAQYAAHSKIYDKLWSEAEKEGFNKVPYHAPTLKKNISFMNKYYGPKQTQNVKDFAKNPTLANAQKAQSDVGYLKSVLEEKNRSGPLLGEERKILDVLTEAEANIQSNMFKNAKGEQNKKLAKRYDAVTESYKDNVVPYKYNTDIQDFKEKDLIEKQLVSRLRIGPFAARKGNAHPELYRSEALAKALLGLGIGAGTVYGPTAYKYVTGNRD